MVNPTFDGRAQYLADWTAGPHRLLVALKCVVDGRLATEALVDTGAEWCVLSAQTCERLEIVPAIDEYAPALHTRFGVFYGRLLRTLITIPVDEVRP